MRSKFLNCIILSLASLGYLLGEGLPEVFINPEINYKGLIRLPKIKEEDGRLFSSGFTRAFCYTEYTATVISPSSASDERMETVLVEMVLGCLQQLSRSDYSFETYLSPLNPLFYYINISSGDSSFRSPKANGICLVKGKVRRIKGKDICNEEEKELLNGKDYGEVWSKPVGQFLEEKGVDPSQFLIDPLLVFEFTDLELGREIALKEIKRIHGLNSQRGYHTLGDRLFSTALRNKGQIREWFFEYTRDIKRKVPLFRDYPFDIDALKRQWLDQAIFILKELNASEELKSYRKVNWGVRDLRLNIKNYDPIYKVAQRVFISWSHCVFEQEERKPSGAFERRKIYYLPLEEFYRWAEAEMEKLDVSDSGNR